MRTTIKIQEFAVPVITRKDQEGFDRGYRRSMAKRGISIGGFRETIVTRIQKTEGRAAGQLRKAMKRAGFEEVRL
jgi:hypothetical protein